jgi:hypothetical protein
MGRNERNKIHNSYDYPYSKSGTACCRQKPRIYMRMGMSNMAVERYTIYLALAS